MVETKAKRGLEHVHLLLQREGMKNELDEQYQAYTLKKNFLNIQAVALVNINGEYSPDDAQRWFMLSILVVKEALLTIASCDPSRKPLTTQKNQNRSKIC